MKNLVKNHLLIFLLLIAFIPSNGQNSNVIRQVSCFDSTIKFQADSLKQALFRQGFIMVKEATMQMESEYEMPVIVPLQQGTWYNIAFIGDITSKLYEVRMYDFNEKHAHDCFFD